METAEAMDRGSTAPTPLDVPMPYDITHMFVESEFRALVDKFVLALKINRDVSRDDCDELTAVAMSNGAPGLIWLHIQDFGFTSPLAKFFSAPEAFAILEWIPHTYGDTIFLVPSNEWDHCEDSIIAVRNWLLTEYASPASV